MTDPVITAGPLTVGPVTVGIFGASGYSGLELLWLLQSHPRVTLRFATSDRYEKRLLDEVLPGLGSTLSFISPQAGEALADQCDVVFLATPAEVSLSLAQKIKRARVIDLSGAFRLRDPQAYPTYYKFTHDAPALLQKARYGLVDWHAAALREAQLVANPGCYATAAALSLAPLLAEKLIEPDVIIDASSGVTGAGRKANEAYSLAELDEDMYAYKVLSHQHTPEIAQTLSDIGGEPVQVTFTAHLLPVRRGILATSYAKLTDKARAKTVASTLAGGAANTITKAYVSAYKNAGGIYLTRLAEEVRLRRVTGRNDVALHVSVDEASGRVVALCAIDNLMKGAAGQAVQAMNAVYGWPLQQAVSGLRGHS